MYQGGAGAAGTYRTTLRIQAGTSLQFTVPVTATVMAKGPPK
jgi:hypothetical protein